MRDIRKGGRRQLAHTTALRNQDKSRPAVNNYTINFQPGFHLLFWRRLSIFLIFRFVALAPVLPPLQSPLLCSPCSLVMDLSSINLPQTGMICLVRHTFMVSENFLIQPVTCKHSNTEYKVQYCLFIVSHTHRPVACGTIYLLIPIRQSLF